VPLSCSVSRRTNCQPSDPGGAAVQAILEANPRVADDEEAGPWRILS
jgi:hypothetical protein